MADSQKSFHWEKTASKLHADCRIFEVYQSRFRHPTGGREGDFYVVNAPDWVTVVAITSRKEMVLVNQFRFGVEELSLEVPGGVIEYPEDPIQAAIRELLEETGYAGRRPELLGWSYPNPAIQNNRCFVVAIHEADLVSKPNWDEHEEIETELIPLSKVPAFFSEGKIRHALSLCALQSFLMKYPIRP